ncbi:zinc transporter ZupT [Breznakiella homolactica]|uniref:Zinc transporter ZupT n=1 Tax=Breznakiella homolactica TaxID=2798577 RepID=A0A7T8BB83_9SPIR|nr:zinc transporter ZupT [Breznakiella homolactica]QQO09770.1 zinc transporter ZupT [Breznakiella homolactica]
METSDIVFAFGLTLMAGLSTGIGSLMAFLSRDFNPKFLAVSLGFSAGVMIYVSLIEIFAKARDSLTVVYGNKLGYALTVVSFFVGIGIIALIDKLVPNFENPHEMKNPRKKDNSGQEDAKLKRMGIFSALAIAIHNFPEGLATFIGALQNPTLGVSIAVAIALHNIPEGIAVSAPIYYATQSRKKAFVLSFLSGLAEPLGALIGFFLLKSIISDALFGYIFAGVAGIMVYISLDELLPTAEEYGEHHLAIGGIIAGMAVMAVSLVIFS